MARDAAAFEAPYGENGHTGERVKDAYLPDARADVGGGDALCEIFSQTSRQAERLFHASRMRCCPTCVGVRGCWCPKI